MRIVILKCDHCGAPLDVPADREQFTCAYCGSGLHIARMGRARSETDDATAGKPVSEHERKLQAELEQLDADWEAYRAEYLPRDGSGEYVIPEPEVCRMGAWITGVLMVVLAVVGVFAGTLGISAIAVVVGSIVIAVLLRLAKIGAVYQRSVRNYRHSRLAIVDQLAAASEA